MNTPSHTILFSAASAILFFIFFALFLSSIGFLLKIEISQYHFYIAIILAILAFYFFSIQLAVSYRSQIIVLIILFFIFVGSFWFSSKTYDLSYDGQTYHQEAIIAMDRGWIPFYERLTPESHSDVSYQRLVNSYPKASEIIQAVIYKAFGHIEATKGLNFIMMFMALGFLLSFFLQFKFIDRWAAILGTVLLVLNPVFIVQSLSFYLDGQLYFSLASLGVLLGFLTTEKKKTHILVLIIMAVTVILNMKLAGAVYAAVFLASFLLFSWYSEEKYFKDIFPKKFWSLALVGVIVIIITGFNPYITNMKWFGHSLYPAYGKNSINYVPVNMPATFYEKNPVERLLLSIISRSEMKRGPGTAHTLKMPFTYQSKEIDSFKNTNNTLGGFGPLFSGAFLTTITIIFGILFLNNRKNKIDKQILIASTAVIFISSVAMPISSYARYVPQLWAIAPLAMILALSASNYILKFLGVALGIILIFNVAVIANRYLAFNFQTSRQLREELVDLRNISDREPLRISFGDFRSNRVRFAEAGIQFREERNLSCTEKKRILAGPIPESLLQYCVLK